MQNKISLIFLAMLFLVQSVSSYTASNSQLNITIYDDYNTYTKEANNLNSTFSASNQAYRKEAGNLNATFFLIATYSASGSTTTSTSTTSTATTAVATTTVASSGGGGGGVSQQIVILEKPVEREVIREIIREFRETVGKAPEVVYQDVVSQNPYRLSIILLTSLFIFLLAIRFSDYFRKPRYRERPRRRPPRQQQRLPVRRDSAKDEDLNYIVDKALRDEGYY